MIINIIFIMIIVEEEREKDAQVKRLDYEHYEAPL